jgi:trehalose 6-phosphate phosphatase
MEPEPQSSVPQADTELRRDDGVLNTPEQCALFLDMDGTLLEMAPSPEAVRIPSGLPVLLQNLSDGLGGALAILTGRQIVEVDRILDPLRLAASGVHGAQFRRSPEHEIETCSPELPPELVAQLVALEGKMPGIRAEAKGPGFAVHYRVVPHVQGELERQLRALLVDYASSVVLSRGRKIFEIVPIGQTKGTALVSFCELPRFKGRRPVMIGDDVGDEPAFAAAARLGGMGLRVAGEHFGRDAANLDGPADVHQLLTRVLERLQAKS